MLGCAWLAWLGSAKRWIDEYGIWNTDARGGMAKGGSEAGRDELR